MYVKVSSNRRRRPAILSGFSPETAIASASSVTTKAEGRVIPGPRARSHDRLYRAARGARQVLAASDCSARISGVLRANRRARISRALRAYRDARVSRPFRATGRTGIRDFSAVLRAGPRALGTAAELAFIQGARLLRHDVSLLHVDGSALSDMRRVMQEL